VTTSQPALADAPARRRIEADLAGRLAVDAGAGSGKTRALIDRVVALASAGYSMASIAAITFTEAAAAELRTRLRATLAERAREDRLLTTAAREVDDAAICTIHAFAHRILVEHWLEAGLPPRVEVLDPAVASLDHRLRWRRFLEALRGDPEGARTLARAIAAGLRLGRLSPAAEAMADHYDRLGDAVLAGLAAERDQAADLHLDVGPLVEALADALGHLDECEDPADGLARHLRRVVGPTLERLRPLIGSADEVEIVRALGSIQKLSFTRGSSTNWPSIGAVRDRCARAETLRSEMLHAVRRSVVADLGWRVAHWVRQVAGERRREGRLSYHDLLVLAVELLAADADVRQAVRDRYRCILIDEFQDTDPLQAELARLLADGDHDQEAARLFVVGDPNQSIYRFRRAEVELFESMAAAMDERLALTANFRSVPEILQFVHQLFSELTGDAGAPWARPLQPVRPSLGGVGPPVTVLGGALDAASVGELRAGSTARVALAIRSIVEEGWTVGAQEGPRPARYRDVAVLMPTRTGLAVLERAFDEAGVPYRLEGAALIWGCQEVRDLLAILRAVDDPGDPVAVVAALRTPALACGDDDLVRHRRAGGTWDPLAPPPPGAGPQDPVVRALGVLAHLHERRQWLEPSALVLAVITELHLFELALVHRRPRDHWHRLRWVLDQARAFDETVGGRLGDFLRWVELHEQADRWSTSPGPPDPDDDAVRVMTIHGAKGLEFPVVVVTGLDVAPSTQSPPVLFDRGGRPRFSFTGDFCSPGYDERKDEEARLDQAERLRLLYVALTRARDHLVVDVSHLRTAATSDRRSLAALIEPCCRLEPTVFPDGGPGRAAPAAPTPPSAPWPPAEQWWAEHRRWEDQRRARLAERARQPAFAATALGSEVAAAGPRPEAVRRPVATADREQQRRIGRAVHDTLAKIPLTPDGILSDQAAEVARASALAQHLEDGSAELTVSLVATALGSPSVRALATRRHWKELPLAAPAGRGLEDGMVEGFADLVGETEGGLVVIDFKTSPDQQSVDEYRGQVAVYAYALEQATGRPVTRAIVSHLRPEGALEEVLEGGELRDLIDQVPEAARRLSGSAGPAHPGQLAGVEGS